MVQWYHEKITTSTQDVVRQYGDAQTPVVVTAGQQQRGRGRYNRPWISPLGNVYMSFNILEPGSIASWGKWSLLLGVATYDALQSWLQSAGAQTLPVTLKWPNDLMLGTAKVGGILLESAGDDKSPWLVAGIGINVMSAPSDLPYKATSLQEWGSDILATQSPETLAHSIQNLAQYIYKYYLRWRQLTESEDFKFLTSAWTERAHQFGTRLTVHKNDEELQGVFDGLDKTGYLLLRDDAGITHTVSAAYAVIMSD
jgi:BirA family biotin operon repressor/biotin-[acetyl-CoA-carboxylase] ligase